MRMFRFAASSLTAILVVASAAISLHAGTGADLAIIDAVRSRNHEALVALLTKNANVNVTQPDGATALHWAAYHDDLDAADRLIKAGAKVNATNELGATPLWLAAISGSAPMIERLLKAGADPNLALEYGETPLMTAARTGKADAVSALLKGKANPNATEHVREQTALMWAAAERHPEVVAALIAGGANVQAKSSPRLRSVKIKGTDTRSRTVGVVDEQQGGFTPLLFAVRAGDVESTKLLVEAGASVNEALPNGASVLVLAAHGGYTPIVSWLLDKGANVNANGYGFTALHAAVLRGDLECVKTLLAHKADPNIPLLHGTAVRSKSMDWSMAGAWTGATPFWMASMFGETQIMRELLTAGANPKLAAKDGSTPLMAAIVGVVDRWGNDDASAGYINKMPEPPDEDRMILDTLKVLLELKLDVNAADQNGDTALHRAASRHLEAVVAFLAEHGANVNVKNKAGRTPLMLTTPERRQLSEMGDGRSGPKTAELLKKYGATE